MSVSVQPPMNDLEYIKSRFMYEPDTGVLSWKEHPDGKPNWDKLHAGRPISGKDKYGYLRAMVSYGTKWKNYIFAHRICYFIYHGYVPKIIDHIDGDRTNNRINNLRGADEKINAWNRASKDEAISKGVSVVQPKTPNCKTAYAARITHNEIRYYLGCYDTPDEAAAAYRGAELLLRSEFARKEIK